MIGTSEERLRDLQQLYPRWQEDTLWTRFEKNARVFKDREFLVYGQRAYTYQQALECVNRLAASCHAQGIREGSHVALILYNSPEYVFLIFALAKLGAVKVPINMKLSQEEKEYIIKQSDCEYLILHSLEKSPEFEHLPKLKRCVVRFVRETEACSGLCIGWEAFWEEGGSIRDYEISVLKNPQALADILYTSGSTMRPKGVMLTHDALLRSSFGTCRTRMMEIGRRMLVPIPLYHIFGYVEGLLSLIWVGGTIILTNQKAEGSYILNLLQSSRANDIICVPIVMIHLLEQGKPSPDQLPHLHAAYWASTCPEWVWDAGKEQLGITDVTTGYGMTECGSTTTMMSPLAPKDAVKFSQGTCKNAGIAGNERLDGKLLEVKICDPGTGEELSLGESGELWCRGLTVTKGYYHGSEQNQDSFDKEGWFATGDLGCFDSQGYFTFQGRKSDMYKINGENVSPQFVNGVLGRCPQIKAVEMVGISYGKYGEIGVAFIDPLEDSRMARRQIDDYLRKHLAEFQIPSYLIVSDSGKWPRTSCGKIQPSALRVLAQDKVTHFENSCGKTGKEITWI